MAITRKLATLGSATLFLVAAAQACGGTVVFEEDGGEGDGGATSVTATASATRSASNGFPGDTAGPASVGITTVGVTTGDTSNVSVGEVTVGVTTGPDTCFSTNDGVCDEPNVCPPGTDASDCQFANAPCAALCVGDPGCALRPPQPNEACSRCVEDQAGAFGQCAVDAAFGSGCQDDPDCSDYVDCQLAAGDDCPENFPRGFALAQALVLQQCASCGDGTIQ